MACDEEGSLGEGVITVHEPEVRMVEVVVRTMVTLHPWDCHCFACDPYHPSASTGCGPWQILYVSLADDEEPPLGWKHVGPWL
jgi:hypothetical protein